MLEIRQTLEFERRLRGSRDRQGRARILDRIERVRGGNMGDANPVGGGVSELRMPFGPGYRVYFARRGDVVILLLIGGDKDSQVRDIATAKALLSREEQEDGDQGV